jgi:hypothetical protein
MFFTLFGYLIWKIISGTLRWAASAMIGCEFAVVLAVLLAFGIFLAL